MAAADPFPLTYPGEAVRADASEEALHRAAKGAALSAGARVLVLGCGGGAAALSLARDLGLQVVAADWDAGALARFQERLKGLKPSVRIEARELQRGASLPFTDSQFEAVLVEDRLGWPLDATVQMLRKVLLPKGRLCLRYPVRVGRSPDPGTLRFWEQKLGEKLRLPRECLQVLERAGFEPQSIETASDVELDAFYHSVENGLDEVSGPARAKLEEELLFHKATLGRASVSFARFIGRRKEPGEKPPPSRHE